MLIEIGKWKLAFGVDWLMPSNKRETRDALKANGKSSYVFNSLGGQNWLGFHQAVSGDVYAGALLIAIAKPNAVVFHPIDDEKAWVCAVRDGMPAVGYDKVLPLSEARSTAIEWSSMFAHAEMIGGISGAETDVPTVLNALANGISEKTIKKGQLDGALLKRTGLSIRNILVVVGVGVSVAAVFLGYSFYQGIRQRQDQEQATLQEAALRTLEQLQLKARSDAEKNAKIANLAVKVGEIRAQHTERVNPIAMWSAFTAVRWKLPISLQGFRPRSIECSSLVCHVNWQGFGRSTVAANRRFLPNVEASLAPELTAVSSFPTQVSKTPLPETTAKSPEELAFLMQSHFAPKVEAFTISAPEAVTVTIDGAVDVPAEIVASKGNWTAVFQSGALLKSGTFVQALARWPMGITNIKYEAGKVELSGEYVFIYKKG